MRRLLGAVSLVAGFALFIGGTRLFACGDPQLVALGGLMFLFSIPMISFPLAYI